MVGGTGKEALERPPLLESRRYSFVARRNFFGDGVSQLGAGQTGAATAHSSRSRSVHVRSKRGATFHNGRSRTCVEGKGKRLASEDARSLLTDPHGRQWVGTARSHRSP